MCGITGFVAAPGAAAPAPGVIERMTAAIAHRGPDGDGFHVEGGVAFGHRRLSIIDVAGGDNPLFDAEGHVAVMFNGEIYNHLGLRAELEQRGRRPRTGSDGEVLVHGYLEWGIDELLRRVRGMFAFALHDRRDGAVHLARDPLGIKPLHLHVDGQGLRFGSEAKSIVAALGKRPALDTRGLFESACLGFILAPRTIYAGIESLPPGHRALYAEGRLTLTRYHRLAFEPGREVADPGELWSRLSTAVDSHLMSEVPLGAFLSGGMDSSAVVAAMSQVAEGGVNAICVGVEDEGLDERPFARQVAESLGVTLFEESARSDLADLLPRLAWHLEAPFADTSAAPTWLVCEAARRHVTVTLSGDGGDENFAGYRRTRYDVLEETWRRRLPGWLRSGLLGPLGRVWPQSSWLPRPLRAGTLLRNLGDDWLNAYVRSMTRVREEQVRRILRPEVCPDEPLRASFEPAASAAQDLDPLSRVQSMDFATWLADDILVKVDRTSMAHGLEVRVPLLDTDFVEWAAGLPGEAKLAGGEGKALFRRALRGQVPDGVIDRPKQGFHLPVGGWLRGDLRERLAEILTESAGPAFDFVDHRRMERLADEHQAERADRSGELWMLMTLDAFLRHGPGGPQEGGPLASEPAAVGTAP